MNKKELKEELEALKRRVAFLEANQYHCHCYKYIPYYPPNLPTITWTTGSGSYERKID